MICLEKVEDSNKMAGKGWETMQDAMKQEQYAAKWGKDVMEYL